MSRRMTEKLRKRLAAETGTHSAPWGGRLTVALVYPNTYHQGMSNLGFQTVYHWLNSREDTLCERFFLPDPDDLAECQRSGTPLVSLESQRLLEDFDLIAFSISFENDYLNLPVLFELGRLPLWRKERDEHYPLVLCGGVCAFLNPEPLADIMDLFAVGEAEVILPELVKRLQGEVSTDRVKLLHSLACMPGIYVPALFRVSYREDGRVQTMEADAGIPGRVKRQWLADIDQGQSRTCVTTPETEFASMELLELSRGCPRGCRFCAAGFIYLPFREHSHSHLRQQLDESRTDRKKIGLVAAAVSDYRGLAELGESILAEGGEVSVSSVRVDTIDADQVDVLARSGHKTLALAPEAGSQRMRDVINKGVEEAQILNAVRIVAEGGIPNLKLYFMIGLPGETSEDVDAIGALTLKIRTIWEEIGRRRGQLGRLTLSVNPFVPKPFTPLQWAPMEARSSLERKYRQLQRQIRPLPNVDLNQESLKLAEVQAFFARGDRRIGHILPALAEGNSLRKACRDAGLDPAFYVTRERLEDECFPWEVIDQGLLRSYLWKEYCQAL
ncbi:MAG: radical SAM protein, partial [Desulfuromonadales bacterium]|nr:radical SAM protein [Desulfuromonadales bacterium]